MSKATLTTEIVTTFKDNTRSLSASKWAEDVDVNDKDDENIENVPSKAVKVQQLFQHSGAAGQGDSQHNTNCF